MSSTSAAMAHKRVDGSPENKDCLSEPQTRLVLMDNLANDDRLADADAAVVEKPHRQHLRFLHQ